VILGRAAILDGMYATQTASFGSESRGGECRAEVIISKNTIAYPLVDRVQTLVAMSQPALVKYIGDLVPGGALLVDPDMIEKPTERKDINIVNVQAAKTADRIGRRIFENIVMLGALQAKTSIVSEQSLLKAIEKYVPPRTLEANLNAARSGIGLVS